MTTDGSRLKEPERKADCYAEGERAMMVFTQRLRGRLFGPLLRALDALSITPDHLTSASLLAIFPRADSLVGNGRSNVMPRYDSSELPKSNRRGCRSES